MRIPDDEQMLNIPGAGHERERTTPDRAPFSLVPCRMAQRQVRPRPNWKTLPLAFTPLVENFALVVAK